VAEAAVVVRDLVKRFGAFTAVDHLSFEIAPGQVFGFLGPNGSGKSTTIRVLCGLLLPTEGEAFVDGLNVGREPERVRERIGYMSQAFSLYGDLTVAENLEFYGGTYGVSGPRFRERSEALLERLALQPDRDRLAATLSTGVRQRLALACALIHQPPILFLDEPTSGVDPLMRRSFFEIIGELSAQGVTTLITTHVMDEAEHCNQLVLIYQGRRVALGTPQELKARVPGRLLEVRVAATMAAADALQGAEGVVEVSLFGTALHVAVADTVASPEEFLRATLAAARFAVHSVRPVRPTLEHAFLALTGGAEAAT
jgi:ABC-2 type transport system ATP-binding protein